MFSLFGVLVVGSCYAAVTGWRGPWPPSSRSPLSPERRDDIRRRAPAGAVVLTMGAVAGLIDGIWGHHAKGAKIAITITITIASAVGGTLLSIAIHYFHRPSWAIPPDLRDPPRNPRRGRAGG